MSMAGYTKLFNSILASTIWREDDKTRLVWITLLALADKNGIAESSIPGLADMAHVSLSDCELALEKLMSPDKYSRTKDHNGRRIEPCDGGWKLLNHGKYRAKMSADERREYNRVKQAEHRQKVSTSVNDSQTPSALSAHTEADSEAKADKYHKDSRTVLHLLNEASKKHFRETDSNLSFISARLSEPDVTLDGVKKMIDRQCKLWLATAQAEYLRPETLFNKTKFDSYYASNEAPINHEISRSTPQHIDRSIGTTNEGRGKLYEGLGRLAKPQNPQ